MIYNNKLSDFAAVLQTQRLAQLIHDGCDCEANRCNTTVKIHIAKKYTRVDVGRSGVYMVVNDTGEIFGIKGYGVIHRGHLFGTLDTIANFWWGTYRAIPLDVARKAGYLVETVPNLAVEIA